MKRIVHTATVLVLALLAAAGLTGCSSSSSPTEADGISSLRSIDGAYDETGSEGIHPDDWDDNHQVTPQGELASCVACHADTSVDDDGCLPCHDGDAAEGEEDEGDREARGPHGEGWEDDHRAATDFGGCLPCHADTSVDDDGCLPCHTGEDGEEEEAQSPHAENWEDDHRAATDFGGCVACHGDTSVDDDGCLPCHTGEDGEDDDEEEDED